MRDFADDPDFHGEWRKIKLANKRHLASALEERTGITVSDGMMFDVQVKRIHEYKRQLLNVLHAIHLYDRIRRGEGDDFVPRAIVIGGKAAPGYEMAKNVIKCVNNVARVINSDPMMKGRLCSVVLP